MRAMVNLSTLLLTTSLLVGKTALPPDHEALQGTWVLQTTEWLGESCSNVPDEPTIRLMMLQAVPEKRNIRPDLKKYWTTLTIRGGRYVWRERIADFGGRQKIVVTEGRYQLDSRRSPRSMKRWAEGVTYEYDDDLGHEVAEGDRDSTPYYCVYRLQGDTLQWCINMKWGGVSSRHLPTGFSTKADRDVVLLTFKRERP